MIILAYVRYSFRYRSRGAICTYITRNPLLCESDLIYNHAHASAGNFLLLDILHGSHDSRMNYTSSLLLYHKFLMEKSQIVSFFSYHFSFHSSLFFFFSKSSPRRFKRPFPRRIESHGDYLRYVNWLNGLSVTSDLLRLVKLAQDLLKYEHEPITLDMCYIIATFGRFSWHEDYLLRKMSDLN